MMLPLIFLIGCSCTPSPTEIKYIYPKDYNLTTKRVDPLPIQKGWKPLSIRWADPKDKSWVEMNVTDYSTLLDRSDAKWLQIESLESANQNMINQIERYHRDNRKIRSSLIRKTIDTNSTGGQ